MRLLDLLCATQPWAHKLREWRERSHAPCRGHSTVLAQDAVKHHFRNRGVVTMACDHFVVTTTLQFASPVDRLQGPSRVWTVWLVPTDITQCAHMWWIDASNFHQAVYFKFRDVFFLITCKQIHTRNAYLELIQQARLHAELSYSPAASSSAASSMSSPPLSPGVSA